MTQPALALSDVSFSWARTGFSLHVEAFTLEQGERILLTAPSGAGKSTLIGLIAGILAPSTGSIAIAGVDIAALGAAARDSFRANNIGLIFQSFNLLPYLSTLDNVLLPLAFAPDRRRRLGGKAEARAAAEQLLAGIGLPPATYGALKAGQLSMGQQQRVAVLRALIGAPGLIVADEPTSALDAEHRAAFLAMLQAQVSQAGSSLIMVSHDLALAPLFDRTVTLASIARTERAS